MELEPAVIGQLSANGILQQGHFAFRNGRHSHALIDRDLLLADPALTSKFGYNISRRFFTTPLHTIVTPSIWGAGLAQWVAYFLEPRAKVVEASSQSGTVSIAPKLAPLIENRRILLVDNLVFSGQTMSELIAVTRGMGATIVGIAAIWSSAGNMIDELELYTVLGEVVPAWAPDDCPVCSREADPPVLVDF